MPAFRESPPAEVLVGTRVDLHDRELILPPGLALYLHTRQHATILEEGATQ